MIMIQKLVMLCSVALVVACATPATLTKSEPNNFSPSQDEYAVVPAPVHLKMEKGKFLLNNEVTLSYDKNLEREALFLQEYLEKGHGIQLKTSNTSAKNKISLQINPSIENPEGYQLTVSDNIIAITGKTTAGVFYALQTLRQLIQNKHGYTYIPAVTISDAPRFPYRGMHLDVGRHFFPIDFIKKYIDLLALHKMNKFHWHLTEDQGWRLEIKKYPKLTEVGAWRAETAVRKNFPGSGVNENFKGDGQRYGGFYTQEQAKEIVKYAAERHITVIPEIDMPGHMLAALASYPELGNGTGPYEVGKWWGVFEKILAPKEETFHFIENVLTEVMEIFPSEYIHIGGDEAPKKEWKESKQAQDLIKKLNLTDDDKHTKEEKLQSYFIQRVEKFVNSHGRKIIGWDEILEGGLAPNATVMSWRGEKGGIAAAKQHHDVIMTPGDYCYFDHYQTQRDLTQQEPFALCCYLPIEKVYSYNPVPPQLSNKEQKHILGAQANVWTEYIDIPEKAEYMAVPRMGALAEVVWTPVENKNYDSFKKRMLRMKKLYDLMDVNYERTFFKN